MDKQAHEPNPNTKQESSFSPNSSTPYETVLLKAFDKLTSQVFIFLLAFLILIIGLGIFAPQITKELRTLLYTLPILGIGAYIWEQQRTIAGKAKSHGIDVKAGITTGEARVTGARSSTSGADLPKNVSVGVGLASDKSRVEGAVIGDEENDQLASDSKYLLETFEQLSPQKRRKVIASTQKLLDEP